MEANEFLPLYDVSDTVATLVDADPAVTWDALLAADLIRLGRQKPLIGLLGAARALPDLATQLVRRQALPKRPERLTLEELTSLPMAGGGWVLLAKDAPRGIALGLVGKFWRPVIQFADVTAETFESFEEPGYAKTLYLLTIRSLEPGRCLLEATMRTATTDQRARRQFRRYWTLGVGPGAHVLANGLVESVRDDARSRAPEPSKA